MSTAKSMAALYLSGKRQQPASGQQSKFKSSSTNLAGSRQTINPNQAGKSRLKSTSMTNLLLQGESGASAPTGNQANSSRIQRPASRNALDSIHNGMNARYAQVQSKVLLQNIRPNQAQSRIPSNKSQTLQADNHRRLATGLRPAHTTPTAAAANERTVLAGKLQALQEDLDRCAEERDQLKQELERESSEKLEQIGQLKQELQEKLGEHEKQNEEYHQKLLEAYDLADQNRRAADSLLAESRQRDEESRKRIDELDSQLADLKEFVAMKEEMSGKMFELREQLREERERYEEQLKSLHQVFENEKIRFSEGQILMEPNEKARKNNQPAGSSNYFNRIKPNLQSMESINSSSKCRKCASSGSQLHKSEHDLYGSKLSTRVHDSARSAWKASKSFASSVITGGVDLSTCRQRVKRVNVSKQVNQATEFGAASCNGQELAAGEEHTSVVGVASPVAANNVGQANEDKEEEQRNELQCANEQPTVGESKAAAAATATATAISTVRVDENNKLTIVTKFSDLHAAGKPESGGQTMASSSFSSASSGTGSEHGRCESSSSGRGTVSEAGSTAASQNGDECESAGQSSGQPSPGARQPSSATQMDAADKRHRHSLAATAGAGNSATATGQGAAADGEPTKEKRHRRRSSLFKASKVFSGSQVSLNKLKNFFTLANGAMKVSQQQQQQHQVDHIEQQPLGLDHLESSRLRCLELSRDQALKVASMTGESVSSQQVDSNEMRKPPISQLEVGQGCLLFNGKNLKLDVVERQKQESAYEKLASEQVAIS